MCFREENNNGIRLSATKQLQQQQYQNAKDVFYVFEVNNFFRHKRKRLLS